MRVPDVFISFDIYDHEKEKDQFVSESIQSSTPFNIRGWSQPPGSDFFRDSTIIKACNILIALVGSYTYRPGNVVQEVKIAFGNDVPVIGVYLRGVGSNTPPPAGLHRTRMESWVYGWDRIGRKVALCLKEQKNLQIAWGSPGDDLAPTQQTQMAMPHSPLEESSLKKLEDYLNFQQKHDYSYFVSGDDICAAARQLGSLKSWAAILPLVKCLLTSSIADGMEFQDALVAIGQPALETLERTLFSGNLGDFSLDPGSHNRRFLIQAIDRIKSG